MISPDLKRLYRAMFSGAYQVLSVDILKYEQYTTAEITLIHSREGYQQMFWLHQDAPEDYINGLKDQAHMRSKYGII